MDGKMVRLMDGWMDWKMGGLLGRLTIGWED
jgi:hypothetical protein